MSLLSLFRQAPPAPEQTVQVADLLRGLKESVWVQTTFTGDDDKKSTSVFMNVFKESLAGHGETLSRGDSLALLANAVAYIHREQHDPEDPEENIALYNPESHEITQIAEMVFDEALAASAKEIPAPAVAAAEIAPAL